MLKERCDRLMRR